MGNGGELCLLLERCRFYMEMQMRTILFLPSFYTFTFSLLYHIGWDLDSILSPRYRRGLYLVSGLRKTL